MNLRMERQGLTDFIQGKAHSGPRLPRPWFTGTPRCLHCATFQVQGKGDRARIYNRTDFLINARDAPVLSPEAVMASCKVTGTEGMGDELNKGR